MFDRELYQGHAVTGIDAKGRVGIPANLRSTIDQNGGGRMVTIAPHPSSPCLVGYDASWAKHLREQLRVDEATSRADGRRFNRDKSKRGAFTYSEQVPFDSSGRFILPAYLRSRAQLTDLAFFCGTGDEFEIWSPQVALSSDNDDEDMKELVEWLMANRGAA